MKRIGIIDVGSNSMRLVIFQITKDKTFFPIEDVKETVRLGEGVNNTGKIREDKIELGMKTMFLFKEICKKNSVDEIIAFGTAALRIAKNGDEVVQKIKKKLDIEIEIFSGEMEALSSFNGAINAMDIRNGVIIDLGGSSLEIVIFKERLPIHNISLPFGGVTVGELGDIKDVLNGETEEKIRNFIRNKLDEVFWKDQLKNMVLIGVGGTVRNIAAIHSNMIGYPLDILHNYKMDVRDVEKVIEKVKNKKYKEKIEIPGLSKSRADLFVGAAIIVEELLKYFQMKELRISGYGIREGVLYKKLGEYGKIVTDVFETSLNDTLNHLGLEKDKKKEIYMNFIKIYQSLLPHYPIGFLNDKIIKTITYFEGIGKSINYYNYEKNSFYMLLNLGLKGIENRELLLSAFIIIRVGKDKDIQKKYNLFLKNQSLEEIRMASKILNLSKIFYEVLSLRCEDFQITIEEKQIVFWIKNDSKIDLDVIEVYISQKRFINSFDREIKFKIKN